MSVLRHIFNRFRNERDAPNTDNNLEVEPTTSSNVAAMSTVQIRESNVENCPMVLGGQPKINYVTINHPVPQPVAAEGSGNESDRRENAFKKALKLHSKYLVREGDLSIQGVNVCKDEIPVVHPGITQIPFYEGKSAPKEERYQPSDKLSKLPKYQREEPKRIHFDELLRKDGGSSFISIIGYPGSGKSVLSKRLARSYTWPHHICWHRKFMDMNYRDKLTIEELICKKALPGLDDDTSAQAFNWLVENDDKATLIFDGFDQAEFELKGNSPKEDYQTPMHVRDIMANLCSKHFLPNCRLIFTSRPHSMIFVPKSLRPSSTLLLGDLAPADMKKMFVAYTGTKSDEIWTKLNNNAPNLVPLCHNPLMLQMIISSQFHPSKRIGDATTLTRVFATVVENLRRSENLRYQEDFNELVLKLSQVAYNATKNGTVVITTKQLRKIDLDPSTVQDIVIQLFAHDGATNSRVFDGDCRLYFCHQTFQEFFAAFYIIYQMLVKDFKAFMKNLFKDHWSVVRRFTSGLLLDLGPLPDSDAKNLGTKKEIFVETLHQQLAKISSKYVKNTDDKALRDKLFDLYACVGKGKDSSIATKAAEHFPTTIRLPQPMNSNLVPGFLYVMKHVTKQLDELSLTDCFLDENSFHEIASVIKEMKPGQIGKMDIYGNHLQPSNIDDVIGLFGVVRDVMSMFRCFIGGDGWGRDANQDERSKLRTALNKIGSGLLVYVDGTILRSQK
ncbi:protein NLRC5-like isoform X1 [Clavelina lepadiformis]|uniref:protein NLRC5-like isoform X1 n=1 Tax=Clavelina lepadiformis TaxID=159417 RepID=UPI0040431781